MQSVDILNECPIKRTPRLIQLEGMFDLPVEKTSRFSISVNMPLDEKPWNIGAIIGPSGSGKSTILRKLWPDRVVESFDWPEDKCLVDGFPVTLGIKDVTGFLSSVGFSSPPAWQRPFHVLSNGEKFRATIARAMAENDDMFAIDEFTSVVDRTVAKIGSAAIAKSVRKHGKKMIVASCHYDILDWLQPDWTFDTSSASFDWRSLRRRPDIRLEIFKTSRHAWQLFKRHHYLSESLSCSPKCFVGFVDGQPAVFTAVTIFPHPVSTQWREHRTVCLPDFQGAGIGNAMSEFVASMFACTPRKYSSVTSHPAMIRHRANSPLWKMTRKPSRIGNRHHGLNKTFGVPRQDDVVKALNASSSQKRFTASFTYVGPKNLEAARQFGVI